MLILDSVESLSKKPPLQNLAFKWWEHVTCVISMLSREDYESVAKSQFFLEGNDMNAQNEKLKLIADRD